VVEASGHVGGRLATGRIDGFVVDRGFQVLNTGYPRVAADLDVAALDMGWLWPGAVIRHDGRASRVVDPRRHPTTALGTLRAPIGSTPAKAAIAAYSARAGYTPVERLLREPETTAEQRLRAAGVGNEALERFFRPFLAGVLLESELATSSRYLDLLWRSFARGRIGLPMAGMQAVGEQLAARLDPARLHLHLRVSSVAAGVGTPGGRLVNSVVLTDAQPAYSPDGRALLASSTLDVTTEAEVRDEIARLHDVPTAELQHLTSVTVPNAQPAALPPLQLRRPVDLGDGIYVCGDHRDTPSIQGAMASGARAARAVLRALRPREP
jgi:phytoene dehydrogenase-like protein